MCFMKFSQISRHSCSNERDTWIETWVRTIVLRYSEHFYIDSKILGYFQLFILQNDKYPLV